MVFLIKVPKGELMRTICSTALVSACAMRFVAASALVAAALCFSAVGVQAASAPLAGNTIYLGGQRAKELKMPVVAFDHAAHAKANACASCHAANPGVEKNSAGLPVNIMQTPVFSAFAGVNSSDPAARKEAFHAACATCHAQKGAGPSLAQCRDCHTIADAAKLPAQKPYKPQMDASLHQRHLTSGAFPVKAQPGLAPGAILAENDPQRCVTCHHAKDFSPTLPPNIDSCRTCHESGPGSALATRDAAYTPPPLRAAAHEVCMKCHASLAEQKLPHGPVDCATCHDKARFEALPRFEASPSIMTMDRPTGVVLTDKVTPPQVPLSPLYPQGPKWPTVMPAVPFDHGLHERALNCVDCHHTSVKQSCITCHTPSGDPKGKNIPLAQAMHSVTSKNSCVNCHTSLTTSAPECAGCHTPRPVSKSGSNCAFCHRAAPGVKGTMGLMLPSNLPSPQAAAAATTTGTAATNGTVGLDAPALPQNLPAQNAQQNAKLAPSAILLPVDAAVKAAQQSADASEAALAASAILLPPPDKNPAVKPDPAANAAAAKALQPAVTPPPAQSAQPAVEASDAPKLGPVSDGLPEKVRIELMSKEFRPVDFAHAQHLQKLRAGIGRKAAGLQGMHAKDGLECAACHHNSPRLKEGMTPPRCVSCHPANLPAGVTTMPDGRPLLKAAYHQRCMDCHTRMKVEKPRATDCQACHIKRDPAEAPVW